MKLYIKGNTKVVMDTLINRGFKTFTVRPMAGSMMKKPSSIAKIPDSCLKQVMDWMAESAELVEGEGYPDGTLLWFSDETRSEGRRPC